MRKLFIAFTLLLIACNVSLQESVEKSVKKHLKEYSKKELVKYKPIEFSTIDSCWSCIYEDEKLYEFYRKQIIFNDAITEFGKKSAELILEYKKLELYAIFNKNEAVRRLNKLEKQKKEYLTQINQNTDSLLYYLTSIRNYCDTFQSEFVGYKIKHKFLIDNDTIKEEFVVNGDSVTHFTPIDKYKELYNSDSGYFDIAVEGGVMYEETIEVLKKLSTYNG